MKSPIKSPFEEFNPFEFDCDYCGKKQVFTEEEIEKVKQKVPSTKNEYFILCQFCKKGYMKHPEVVIFSGLFEK